MRNGERPPSHGSSRTGTGRRCRLFLLLALVHGTKALAHTKGAPAPITEPSLLPSPSPESLEPDGPEPRPEPNDEGPDPSEAEAASDEGGSDEEEYAPSPSPDSRNGTSPLPDGYDDDYDDEVVWEVDNTTDATGTLDGEMGDGRRKPHIVLWMTDDQGWGNIGYHNSHVHTPTMDALAREGIRLERHYTYTWCSPSRASLLTGRLPHRLWEQADHAVPQKMQMLPAILRRAGYVTAHVGKWHVGNTHRWQTPESRGFDFSHAFLGAAIDYHSLQSEATAYPCKGIDAWKQGKPFQGAHTGGSSLHQQDTEILARIRTHTTNHGQKPLFLYAAVQSMHSPTPDPPFNLKRYARFSHAFGVANGLITQADNMLGQAVAALKKQNMWRRTFLIHLSDNGGSITPYENEVRGTNYPLRGGKNTPWEGGVRTPAFLSGGYLPTARHGKAITGQIHIADWYTTLAYLSGLKLGKGSSSPDGKDVLPYILGRRAGSPRQRTLLSTRNTRVGSMDAYLSGKYKLMLGHALCDCYSSSTYPNHASASNACNCDATGDNHAFKGRWMHGAYTKGIGVGPVTWLFDVTADPSEKRNLASSHKALARKLRLELERQKRSTRHYADPDKHVPAAVLARKCKAFVEEHGGFVGPFLG